MTMQFGPSYEGYQWPQSAVFVDDTFAPGAGGITVPAFSTLGIPALGVTAFPGAAGRISLKFGFYLEQGPSTQLGEHGIVMAASGSFRGSIPVLGPWTSIFIDGFVAGADTTLKVWPTAKPAPILDNATAAMLMATHANPINAGATETIEGQKTWPGMASWMVGCDAGPMTFELCQLSLTGVRTRIGRKILSGIGAQAETEMVALGGEIPEIRATNGGAAVTNWYTSLVAVPHLLMD